MGCNQKNCDQPAAFRFTWPGQDEAGICIDHVATLQNIAAAMGLHLQVIPLTVPGLDKESKSE